MIKITCTEDQKDWIKNQLSQAIDCPKEWKCNGVEDGCSDCIERHIKWTLE